MKAWNRKRKPKWSTKPKWKTRALPTSKIRPYLLVTREMKSKYKDKRIYSYFRKNKPALLNLLKKEPKFKIIVRNRNY